MTHVTCTDQLRNPTFGNGVLATFTFFTSDYLRYLRKKTICNPLVHRTWKCTTLTCEVSKFFYVTEDSHRPPARQDKTVLSVWCLVCRCELDDCSERVPTSNSPSATVSSYREFDSYHRSGRDADKTVSSCLAWRCEFASKQRKWRAVTSQSEALLIARAAVRGLYYRRRHTKHYKI